MSQQFINQIRCLLSADMSQNRTVCLDALLIEIAFGHSQVLDYIQDVFVLFGRNPPVAPITAIASTVVIIPAMIAIVPAMIAIGIGTGGMIVALGWLISGGISIAVEIERNAQQRRSFLQRIRGCCFQIISKRYHLTGLPGSGNPA